MFLEYQIVSLNSGGYTDRDSQNELTLFKTFHGSQRDEYTDNGAELEPDNYQENIPLTESTANVEDTPLPSSAFILRRMKNPSTT